MKKDPNESLSMESSCQPKLRLFELKLLKSVLEGFKLDIYIINQTLNIELLSWHLAKGAKGATRGNARA
jgi:hypothetical protein